jgi:Fanconi anemia group M protein
MEHPKFQEIIKIVWEQLNENPDSRVIVFTHYRDTSSYVTRLLKDLEGVRPARFIGQAGKGDDKGLTQKQQGRVIQKFKQGDCNVLIATSVAEEGLDIPSTELVVFYEPVPSEIRNIQRRGRTGRKMPGKVIILITKGTPDEGYYWSAKRKEKRMRRELELLRSKLDKKFEGQQAFYNRRNAQKNHNQKTLKDYEGKQVTIAVDHREYRSQVVRHLADKKVLVEPQQLDIGDYILSSRIGVERKNANDFLESLIQGKLFGQIARLRDAYARPILIIEGEPILAKRNINHNAIFGSMISIIVDFGVPILVTKNELETASLLYIMAKREQKGDKKTVVIRGGKNPMSLRERQEFVIEGFPHVSWVMAQRLLECFGSIKDIVNATEADLQAVDGIGKQIALDILEVLHARYLEK